MMDINLVIGLAALVALVSLFVWLARRAWRTQRALLKWPGVLGAGLAALVGVGVLSLAAIGLYRVYLPTARPAPTLQVAQTPEQVARGERLAHLCIDCHASRSRLPLDGGSESDLGFLGTLVPPNLTPAGPLQGWSDGEIVRAIREGIHANGRSLLLMPSDQYRHLSDDDVQALVAYLRTQPAVARQTPPTQLNVLGAAVMGTGVFPLSAQPPMSGPLTAPQGETPAHGAYLVSLAGCPACHGEDLRGGTSRFTPSGPNLPAIVGQWSAEEFVATMQTGVDPYGHALDASRMPWDDFAAAFSEAEWRAVHTYLTSLPPAAETARPAAGP